MSEQQRPQPCRHRRPSSGDISAIENKHNELGALLEYICLDDFQSFGRLSSGSQKHILKLARSTSLEMGELISN